MISVIFIFTIEPDANDEPVYSLVRFILIFGNILLLRACDLADICGGRGVNNRQGGISMLWTIVIILLVLWALGLGLAGQVFGGFIHILLAVAVIVFIVQLVRGRSG